jgi:hypothetical protein
VFTAPILADISNSPKYVTGIVQWIAPAAGTEAEAWQTLTAALGLEGVSAGQRWTAPAGVPALSGVLEPAGYHGNAVLRG